MGTARVAPSATDVALAVAGMGLVIVVGLGLTTRGRGLPTDTAGWLTESGRWSALIGTYGILLVLLLAARVPVLEREVGLDRLMRWHRLLAPWALVLIGSHLILITAGYAAADGASWLATAWDLLATYPWILPATAGFLLLMIAGVSSWRVARRRMRYETWWVTHLYTYLAVALAFGHQIVLGQQFVGHMVARAVWIALYAVTAGALIAFRLGLPLWRAVRYRMHVVAVIRESPDTVSIWVKGHNLHKLPAQGGQFFCWRFLTRDLWWQAHPYSLSRAPLSDHLRITVKDLGDHSGSLAQLTPGTRVIAEGPYGTFTSSARSSDRIVLIAGGVGVTPIRAVLEELPATSNVDVLYRAPRADAIVLRHELDAIAACRPHTRIRYLIGRRHEFPVDARSLQRLIPDIASSDLYVCGPADLVASVQQSAQALGIPANRLHDEAFSFHSADPVRPHLKSTTNQIAKTP